MTLLLDSYGLENCGYCWANAIDGRIQHHENCKIGNLQADADRRLELLKNCRGDLANARRSAWSWKKATDRRGELLRDALEAITLMTLQDAELRMAIKKELADA